MKTVVHMVNRLRKNSKPYPVMNTHVTFAFYGVGKNWAGLTGHRQKSKGCLHIHDRLILLLVGVGKV